MSTSACDTRVSVGAWVRRRVLAWVHGCRRRVRGRVGAWAWFACACVPPKMQRAQLHAATNDKNAGGHPSCHWWMANKKANDKNYKRTCSCWHGCPRAQLAANTFVNKQYVVTRSLGCNVFFFRFFCGWQTLCFSVYPEMSLLGSRVLRAGFTVPGLSPVSLGLVSSACVCVNL